MGIVGTRFLLTRTWTIRPWPKRSHTINFCRVWVGELGLSWIKRFVAWAQAIQKHESRKWMSKWKFYSWACIRTMNLCSSVSSLLFFPFFSLEGLLHIIQAFFYHLGLTLVDHSNPHLSTCSIRHPYQFFVSCSDQGSTVQGSSLH